MLKVKVHAANIHDSKGAKLLLDQFQTKSSALHKIKKLYADKGYRGALASWVKKTLGTDLEIVKTYSTSLSSDKRFYISPKRWIVERTFAWLNNFRRLSKDYERLTQASEAWYMIAAIALAINKIY